jgi:uncharacterized protein YndB with AHSA1/START domain
MRWVLIVVGVLASITALVWLIGSQLPQGHSASRQLQLPAAPEAVWATITDIQAFPSWRSDVKRVMTLPDVDGRRHWIEDTRAGQIPLVVQHSDPPRLLVVRIADPKLPFGGTWTYAIAPAPGGSTVTITEDGQIYNPIFRFMSRFVFGYDDTMKTYLANLEKKLGARQG